MKSIVIFMIALVPLKGIEIKVDYRYDSEGFFDNPAAKVVIEAAAARWSRIINQTLLPVDMKDEELVDGRFEIIHPGTGKNHVLSAAASKASDFYFKAGQPAADEYLGGFSLDENVWILYAGARKLDGAGRGAPIGGARNLASVYADPESFLNRGFNLGVSSLTVIGGTVSFDLDRNWSFGFLRPEGGASLDFYSIAVHEIGHCLGLNARSVAEFRDLIVEDRFVGKNSVAALEADTGGEVVGLEIVKSSSQDYHWRDGEYHSKIFPLGTPLYFGTVGAGNLQDLLMEPVFNVGENVKRLEITNVDAAALKDIGWSVISEDPPRGPDLDLEIGPSNNGGLSIRLMSEAGATYTVQTSPDGCSWVSVIPSFVGDGGPLSWSDGQEGTYDPFGPASALAHKYYRVIKD
jgi:hypothetical protein